MNNAVVTALSEILADAYAITLKTQNYHWNVTGPMFYMLHKMFEEQYDALADEVDTIAERIRALGHKAPASFSAFQRLTNVKEGHADAKPHDMLLDLGNDHRAFVEKLKKARAIADNESDIGSIVMLEDLIRDHEKTLWMLTASV